MRALRAFVLGALAVGLLAYVAVAVVALGAEASGSELALRVGPVVLVAVERQVGASSITFGGGLAVVALAGGVANTVGALLLARRERGPRDRVH